MTSLRVRAYNVLFGDALLVSVPDRDEEGRPVMRHLLIDTGNLPAGHGGGDAVFARVFEDIDSVLDGRPLDMYVMSHEHMDHVQGPLYAAARLGRRLHAEHVWMPASSAPGYYDAHPDAQRKRLEALDAHRRVARFLDARQHLLAGRRGETVARALLADNDPAQTQACVDHIRGMSTGREPFYVHRGVEVSGRHPFRDAGLRVWAPEENSAVYYGTFPRRQLGIAELERAGDGPAPASLFPPPPPGVDAGTFHDLCLMRSAGVVDDLLAIDKAGNNSGIVFSLEWQGWRLLFPGDCEQRSWHTMAALADADSVLQPVHVLKVAHHGSSTGLPPDDVLDRILPMRPDDDRERHAVVSTCRHAYPGVPSDRVLHEIERRVTRLHRTTTVRPGAYVDIELAAPGEPIAGAEVHAKQTPAAVH